MPQPRDTAVLAAPALDAAAVTTVLCDADGNLFPSEEPAFEASAEVTNRLLASLGSTRRYAADELRREALGRNFRSMAQELCRAHGHDLPSAELERWVAEEARVVTEHLRTALAPDPATATAIGRLARTHRLAVVSSSALPRLAACFTAVDLDAWFPVADRFSAQDSLPAPTSKPDPAVYRHALDALGLDARAAVAVEDAVAGVRSAVDAGIAAIGNLAFVAPDERAGRAADLIAAGAAAVVEDWAGVVDLLAAPGPTAPPEERS